MAVRYYFLALEKDYESVTDWFAGLSNETTVLERPDGSWYYFRAMAKGPLLDAEDINQESTPLVWISKPQKRNGALWTNGEVIFTPTPLKPQFPELNKISIAFGKWLKQFDLVFSQKTNVQSEWAYYLEAGIQNFNDKLFALPMAMEALRNGQYFVHNQANPTVLDTVVKTLRLRGYNFDTV